MLNVELNTSAVLRLLAVTVLAAYLARESLERLQIVRSVAWCIVVILMRIGRG